MNERDQTIPDHFPDPLRREAQPGAVAIVSGVAPKKNTDDTRANFEIASHLRNPGQPDEADAPRVTVPEAQPQQFDTLVRLGHSARQRGDRAASLAHFEAASAVDPAEVGVRLERANDLRELGRLDEAESLLRTVLEEHPQHLGAVVGLGHVLRRRGDRTGSLAQFQAAGAVNPDDVGVQTEIATGLRELGRFDEAEVVLRAALQSQPQHFWALVGLGQLLRRRGDRTGSSVQYRAAAAINPNEIWVQIEIATDLRELGHFDEAEAVLRPILQSQPQHFGALVGLGHVLRRRGDRTGSLAQFQAAGTVNPDDVGVQTEIAADLRELGHFDEAEVVLRAAGKRQKTPAVGEQSTRCRGSFRLDVAWEHRAGRGDFRSWRDTV